MKKLLSIALIATTLWSCGSSDEQKQPVANDAPLAQSANSDAFNQQFETLLTSYYSLSEALVNWDSTKANTHAAALVQAADGIAYAELKADSMIVNTAKSLGSTVAAEAKAIAAESGLENKRRSFYTLSENLYNLIRTVRYDKAVVYHMNCPMAFNDEEEAFWISKTADVVNPYLGTLHPRYKATMLNCGNVADSIDFRAK